MMRRLLVLPALTGLAATTLAGCGGPGSGRGDGGGPIVVGTTDRFTVSDGSPAPLDPAASYDIGSWNVFDNTFQSLLRFPRGGTDPEPEAAEECGFGDMLGAQYRCTLRDGLEFSNGHELTSEDVKFSIDRMLGMKHENGPSSLLANIDRTETPSAKEVVFHLKEPDATFPHKLATPAGAIVDSEVYREDELLGGYQLTGSGPYRLVSWKEGERAVFERNPRYRGGVTPNNSGIELRFFRDSAAMEKALLFGDIDVMNRTVTPAQVARLADGGDGNVELTEAAGTEIRYLVFDTDDPALRQPAVRRAIARIVDRQEITRDVYGRTAAPLYSIVPQGITGHLNSFYNTYGEPDPAAARETLRAAGITDRIPLTLAYTTDHYGEATAAEFELLKKQLDGSGLFDVTLKGVEWQEYKKAARNGDYAAYGMGWFPDFPDPDNYIAPFFGADNVLGLPYVNTNIRTRLLPGTRQEADRGATVPAFREAQDEIARDVPLLPLWQGKQYLAARSDITGTEWALSASSTTRFWELGRGAGG